MSHLRSTPMIGCSETRGAVRFVIMGNDEAQRESQTGGDASSRHSPGHVQRFFASLRRARQPKNTDFKTPITLYTLSGFLRLSRGISANTPHPKYSRV